MTERASSDEPIEGIWWLHGNEPSAVGGVLQLGRVFELRTMGSLTGAPPKRLTDGTINGVARSKAVTLLGCTTRRNKFTIGGYSTSTFGLDVALMGSYAIANQEEAIFDRVRLTLDNLTSWTGRPAYELEHHEQHGTALRNRSHQPLVASVPGAVITLSNRAVSTENGHQTAWTTVERIELELEVALTVPEIERIWIRPIRYLLSLATGEACDSTSLEVAQSAAPDPRLSGSWFETEFYRGRYERPVVPAVDADEMLFTMEDFSFPEMLPKWFMIVGQCGTSIDLIFALGAPGNIFVSNRMFNAVSALEGLHQQLYPEDEADLKANQRRIDLLVKGIESREERRWVREHLAGSHRPFLRQRLAQLIERSGAALRICVDDVERWTKVVKEFRDLIGHGANRVDDDLTAQVRLTATMELLYKSILMRELGFENEECARRFAHNKNWSYLEGAMRDDIPDLFGGRRPAS